MAITALEQQKLIQLAVGMFNGAPGTLYLNELAGYVEGGSSIADIAASLSATSAFKSVYPTFSTAESLAAKFLSHVGLEGNALATNYVVGRLNSGDNFGTIIYEGLEFISGYTAGTLSGADDAALLNAKEVLANKVEVATYYTVDLELSDPDLDDLQAVIAGVDETQASVDAAKAAIDASLVEDTYEVSASATNVDEGATVIFNVATSGLAAGTVLGYEITGIDAADLSSGVLTGSVTLDASGNAAVSVVVAADALTEGVETMNFALLNGRAEVDVVINDTSLTPVPVTYVATAANVTVDEGDAGTKQAVITVTLDKPAESNVVVNYQVSGGTATPANDFVLAAGAVTFAVGQDTAQVAVTINGDEEFEDDETVLVSFSGNNVAGATSTVTITNDDPDPATVPIEAVLTTGVDNVQTGPAADIIYGNQATYNPGDAIDAGGEPDGTQDTLQVEVVLGQNDLNLGNATVAEVERMVLRVTGDQQPGTPGNSFTGPEVILGFTNWDDQLQTVEILESTGNVKLLDLQSVPLVDIDDMTNSVWIDVDAQIAAGNADAIDIDVREIGRSAEAGGTAKPFIVVDDALERLNITDQGDATTQSNFILESDFTGAGFNTVAIDGGVTGADLTLEDVNSSAATVVVDSTVFAGDLYVDVDGVDTVMSGVGADTVIGGADIGGGNGDSDERVASPGTFTGVIDTMDGNDQVLLGMDLTGSVNTGQGNDIVSLYRGNDGQGGDQWGDMYFPASILAGTGADNVQVGDMWGGTQISGDDGNDTIGVNGANGVAAGAVVLGGEGGDNITVAADVHGYVDGGDDNDNINVGDDVTGQVVGDAGNDTIIVGGDVGNDEPVGGDAPEITGDAGNDFIDVGGDLLDDGIVDAGIGDDFVRIRGDIDANDDGPTEWGFPDPAQLLLGDGNDTAEIWGETNGLVDAGDGNDLVRQNWDSASTGNNGDLNQGTVDLGLGDDDLIVQNADVQAAATVMGDDGDDSMTMRSWLFDGAQLMSIIQASSDVSDANNITSIETLNLDVDPIVTATDAQHSGTFSVELDAFDGALETINLRDNDGTARAILYNIDGEEINVFSNGAYDSKFGIWGNWDARIDAMSANQFASDELTINLQGTNSYDFKLKDDNVTYDFRVINLENNETSGPRAVKLDGDDGNANNTVLNLGGTATGNLTVMNVASNTVDGSGYAGNVYLQVLDEDVPAEGDGTNDEDKTIMLGDGDDYVDFTRDFLNVNVVGGTIVSGDYIDLGLGRNTLAVDNSLRNLTPNDQDGVGVNVRNVQVLETNGDDGGVLELTLEDDLRPDTVNVRNDRNDTGERGNVDLDIDEDFDDDAGAPDLLTVDVQSSDVDIDNGASVDMDVYLWANEGYSNANPYWFDDANSMFSNGGGAGGAGVMFDDTGDGVVNINVAVNLVGTTNMSNNQDTTVAGNVELFVDDGEIDSLTFLDFGPQTGLENGWINVTWDDLWAQGGDIEVDASEVNNQDFANFVGVTKDTDGTNTGGMTFIGVAENDLDFEIDGTQNDDVIWGGQDDDEIRGNDGDDFVNADPGLGTVVNAGVQKIVTVDFDQTDDVEAGDTYTIFVGNGTFSWTATADDQTVADAVTALAAAIDGANIDGDADADVSATADTAAGSVTITGIDLDNNFGYALGENWFVDAEVVNRPTAIVTFANEPVDVGDTAEIRIDGTPYQHTVGALDTIANVDAGLVAAINGGAQMSAEAGSVVLRGLMPATAYQLEALWNPDLVTVPAVSATIAITFTGGTGNFEVNFNAASETAATVDLLRDALNTNPIVNQHWFASTAANVLTLTAVVPGAALPSLVFQNASVDGGSASYPSSPTPGADEITRTNNSDPTIAASKIMFTFADPAYDAGDVVNVVVDGTTYAVTLPTFPIVGETDENHDGATVAAVVRAALNANAGFVAAGLTASDDGAGTLSITTTDGAASTFSVTIDDIEQNGTAGPSNEQVTIDFSTMNDPDGLTVTVGIVTVDIDSQGTVAATLAAAQAALNGTAGYTVTVDGTNLVFNSDASGVEPDVDGASITAAITSDGGAVTVTPTAGVPAVRESETIDFSTMTAADGAQVVLGGVTYAVLPQGTVADTLEALRVKVAAAGTDWTPSVNGTDFILTGDAAGNEPAQAFGGGAINADAGAINLLGDFPGDEANGEEYTISIDLVSGTISSVSLTFDTNDNNTVDVLDQTLTSTDNQGLVNLINATPGISATLGGEWTATWISETSILVTGPATGVGGVSEPLLATFTGGTGTTDITQTLPPDPTANPWLHTVQIDESNPGETVRVILSDGSEVVVPYNATEFQTASDLAAAVGATIGSVGSWWTDDDINFTTVPGGAIADNSSTDYVANHVDPLNPTPLVDMSVTISGLSHTWAGDLDIYLTGPNGARVLLMSDIGGSTDYVNNTLTFEDGAPALLPGVDGTYAPTGTSDGGLSDPPGPFAATFADAFYGIDPNGAWTLTVEDDAGGDVGSFTSFTLTINGDVLTFIGPASGSPDAPAATVVAGDIYTITPVGNVNVDSQLAIPETIDLDFSNLDLPTEVGVVTFANGESFSGATITEIIDAINNDTADNGLVTGPNGYIASDLGGNVIRLTGTVDASPVAIAYSSAQIIATNGVTVTEDQESWENADNANPVVTVISGLDNSDPDVNVDQNAWAAPVATEYGNDTVYGGIGDDTINGLEGNDSLLGEDGNDVLNGGAGSDVLSGGNHDDLLNGGSEGDQLLGGSGNDVLNGDGGNDYLDGGTGADVLNGGVGNDQLIGGEGNDFLYGSSGYDQMWGGLGWSDLFRFEAGLFGGAYSDSNGSKFNVDPSSQMDRIYDWESWDQLDINLTNAGGGAVPVSFFANVQGTTELIAALEFGGGQAGRAVFDQNESLLYVDTNGDGTITTGSDLIVWLVDQEGSTLAQGNFV